MGLDQVRAEVARLALDAAAAGFALAGGNALVAHGLLERRTHDVDLFSDRADRDGGGGAEERRLRRDGQPTTRAGLAAVAGTVGPGQAEKRRRVPVDACHAQHVGHESTSA